MSYTFITLHLPLSIYFCCLVFLNSATLPGISIVAMNGNLLVEWSCTNNLHTLYDPKQATSFQSARWNSGTIPDVTFPTHKRGITSIVQEKSPNSFLTLSTGLFWFVQRHSFFSPEQLHT